MEVNYRFRNLMSFLLKAVETISRTFSPELAGLTLYVIDVAQGDGVATVVDFICREGLLQ